MKTLQITNLRQQEYWELEKILKGEFRILMKKKIQGKKVRRRIHSELLFEI